MKTFPEILKEKRDYYGNTEAAIEFAAEEYARQANLKLEEQIMNPVAEETKDRKNKVFDFVVRHKTDCYRAFKICADHKGFNTKEGSALIELVRSEIGYSRKTWDGDIYFHLWRVYKSITIDGVNSPDEKL